MTSVRRTTVAVLSQLARQELIELCIKHAVGHKLHAPDACHTRSSAHRTDKTSVFLQAPALCALCTMVDLHQARKQDARTLRFLLIAELAILGKGRESRLQGCTACSTHASAVPQHAPVAPSCVCRSLESALGAAAGYVPAGCAPGYPPVLGAMQSVRQAVTDVLGSFDLSCVKKYHRCSAV